MEPAGSSGNGPRQGLQTSLTSLTLRGAFFDADTKQLRLATQHMDSCAVDLHIHPQAKSTSASASYQCPVYGSTQSEGVDRPLLELCIKLPAGLHTSECLFYGVHLQCKLEVR